MLDHNCKGWLVDVPSCLDYRISHPKVAELAKTVFDYSTEELMATSLRGGCSPVENQLNLGSCTANAGVGALEYLQRAWYGEYIDMSRLYIYLRTRELMNPEKVLRNELIGDTGASIRSTVAAIVTCGAPPEKYWPYKNIWEKDEYGTPKFEQEPPEIAKAIARKFEGIHYVRLETLAHIKAFLRAGFPVIIGFAVFASMSQADIAKEITIVDTDEPLMVKKGIVPYPSSNDALEGGHAILLIGYNNNMKSGDEQGYLEFKNSWGIGWGDSGYGYLPFRYITDGLASDFWTFLSVGYVKGLL